eukprot:scaffold126088_cov63-Phaeocystis_antarctica.AAC.3
MLAEAGGTALHSHMLPLGPERLGALLRRHVEQPRPDAMPNIGGAVAGRTRARVLAALRARDGAVLAFRAVLQHVPPAEAQLRRSLPHEAAVLAAATPRGEDHARPRRQEDHVGHVRAGARHEQVGAREALGLRRQALGLRLPDLQKPRLAAADQPRDLCDDFGPVGVTQRVAPNGERDREPLVHGRALWQLQDVRGAPLEPSSVSHLREEFTVQVALGRHAPEPWPDLAVHEELVEADGLGQVVARAKLPTARAHVRQHAFGQHDVEHAHQPRRVGLELLARGKLRQQHRGGLREL